MHGVSPLKEVKLFVENLVTEKERKNNRCWSNEKVILSFLSLINILCNCLFW